MIFLIINAQKGLKIIILTLHIISHKSMIFNTNYVYVVLGLQPQTSLSTTKRTISISSIEHVLSNLFVVILLTIPI